MNKTAMAAGRTPHAAHMPTVAAPSQEPLQLISNESHSKTSGEQAGGDTTEGMLT